MGITFGLGIGILNLLLAIWCYADWKKKKDVKLNRGFFILNYILAVINIGYGIPI